jgi:hypothetical protein
MIKMDKIVVIGILFIIFFVVCCTCTMREGYISDIVTGPNDNTLVINDDNKPVAVITDDDDIYINEDAIEDDNNLDDAEINNYYGRYGNSVTVARGPRGNTAVAANVNNPPGNPNDYILKSQVVPPVCPVCPSLIAAGDSDSDSDSDGDDDDDDDDDGDGDGDGEDENGEDGDNNGTCTNESCYQGNTYKREVNVKCPPCPPCARCPEPAFDCKKVPTYRESDDRYLPRPILSDFSTFGM